MSSLLNMVEADDDGADTEIETVVIRDEEKLPPRLKKQFEAMPDAERARIYATIRTSGLKLPVAQLKEPPADDAATTARREQATLLLQKFAGIKQFSRSTSEILAARGERIAEKRTADGPSAGQNVPQTLETLIAGDSEGGIAFPNLHGKLIAGDWKGIQEQLALLPPPAGSQVYTIMLSLLSTTGETLAPADVLALAEASPTKLERRQIAILARLLVPALQKVDRPDTFLAQLRKGGKRLGNADAERRAATARLLIAANLLDEAVKYLAPLEEAVTALDADQLSLHGLVWLHRAQGASDEAAARRAWELTRLVLDNARHDSPAYREVFSRATLLLGQVPAELSGPWLRSVFENEPRQGIRILAGIARQLDAMRENGAQTAQLETLAGLRLALQRLTPVARAKPEVWGPSLQLLVLQWARHVQAIGGVNSSQPNDDSNRRQNLPPAVLVASAPDDACLEQVDSDVAWHVRRIVAVLAARAGDKERATALLREFAKHDPPTAVKLGEEYLSNWVARMTAGTDDVRDNNRDRSRYIYSSRGRMVQRASNGGDAVPLTRSRQARSLAELHGVLGELKELGVPPLGEDALVAAFVACHSPAEVYREEDVARAFGPIETLPSGVALKLSAVMRMGLGGQWRNSNVQDASGTHRTDAEIIAEIKRGYELAIRMLQPAAERVGGQHLDQPQLLVALGALHFDHAEFLYDQHADLATYVKARDRAFASYRRAHAVYAKQLADLPPEKHTAAIYGQWFQSALGASDKGVVSPKDQPNGDQVQEIAAAIRSLEPAAAHEHLLLFGKELGESLNQIPPHMKPWLMREALRVLGDHESSRPFQRLVDYYHDLLGEIELHVGIDGNRQVGREPFGAQVVVRGTTAVVREAGGFAALLAPGTSAATGEPVNRKDKLEKEIRAKLGQSFDILQLRFHEPNVQPHTFGRDGWRETPLAYAVLRAKDPAVDRLVPIQLDLEFNDGHGIVLLPINSEPQLIDAHTNPPAARPLDELKVKQTLDDRKMADNVVRLEIAATGKGLIPDLPRVLRLGQPGAETEVPDFAVTSVADHGLSVSSLSADGGKAQPLCERRWTVELAPRAGARPAEFRFPGAAAAGAELTFARFDDADLVDAAPIISLRSWPLAARDWIPAAVAIGVVAVLIVIGVVLFRRAGLRRRRQAGAPRYRLPEPLTPFTAVALLKRLDGDLECSWGAAERSELAAEINAIERRYFARGETMPVANGHALGHGDGNGQDDLDALLRRWLQRAPRLAP